VQLSTIGKYRGTPLPALDENAPWSLIIPMPTAQVPIDALHVDMDFKFSIARHSALGAKIFVERTMAGGVDILH
jgi:hypothetical protein